MSIFGSCRFRPYFKIEVWDARHLCWRPVKGKIKTEGDAIASKPISIRSRIIKMTEFGSEIIHG